MTGKVFVAALAGAVVLFLWGGVSWMALPKLGLDLHPVHELTGAESVIASLGNMSLEEGVYYGPSMQSAQNGQPAIGFMVWKPEGFNPNMTISLVGGFLLAFLQALLAAFLLNIAAPRISKGYGGRVLFCVWLGIFACLVVHMMYANWMMFPLEYTLGMVADTVIGWLLAGLVLAALIRPPGAADPAPAA